MTYAKLLAALLAVCLSGCASLNSAGTASYSVKPVIDGNGQAHCCEVVVSNGKEIAVLDAEIEKQGDNYKVRLHEEGVRAFEGQTIAAGAAKNAASNAVKAAAIGGAVLASPLVAPVAGAAMASGTAGAAVAGAAGAVAIDRLSTPAQ